MQNKVGLNGHGRENAQSGRVVWLTGLSAAGKSTIAAALARALADLERPAYVLDGDEMRRGLCSDLGFSPEHRKENIRRVGEVAKLFADAGLICIAAFISPYRSDRELVRSILPPGRFVEVFVNAPVEVCAARDPKGLYRKARSGEIKNFTGVSAPYEVALKPEIELRTDQIPVADCVRRILDHLNLKMAAKETATRTCHDTVLRC